jgi:hypothetical protein
MKRVMPVVHDPYVKRYTLELPPVLHGRMRELARRKRVQIGVVYEEALRTYLDMPENYMGKAKQLTSKPSTTTIKKG